MTVRAAPRDQRPLDDDRTLTAVWQGVLGPEPLRFRVVWLLFLDSARCPVGPVITLDNLPDGPYDVPLGDLVSLCREFIDGPGAAASVAFALSRPGGTPWTVSDRAWIRFLSRATVELGTQPWPVHGAHQQAPVTVVAP